MGGSEVITGAGAGGDLESPDQVAREAGTVTAVKNAGEDLEGIGITFVLRGFLYRGLVTDDDIGHFRRGT
jgi:hypothetical protein